jgi:hypothetical protein
MFVVIKKLIGSRSFGEPFCHQKDFPNFSLGIATGTLGNFPFGRHQKGEKMANY